MNISETIITSRQKIERYELFKDIKINTESVVGKSEFPKDWKKIKFNKVSFSYKDEPVLSNLNLEIKRGEKIGIVGLSGAGKSTLFKLLLKEREDYEGEILFDESKLKDILPVSYRKNIGIVLQDTEVFNMSLKDNIIIGAEYDKDYFNKVLEIAHVKDFSDKLKEGVNTYIGEKGIKLSGGERQRLGIARALFKKPEILLLDEATSHLDLESEAKIKDSLHKAFASVTAIVIAHRLTTIKEMDRILLIEEGRVVEDGNFDDLHNLKGRFHDLWEMQKII
jgi:ABC-type multidrug transport system fused ATPase/permease subunit